MEETTLDRQRGLNAWQAATSARQRSKAKALEKAVSETEVRIRLAGLKNALQYLELKGGEKTESDAGSRDQADAVGLRLAIQGWLHSRFTEFGTGRLSSEVVATGNAEQVAAMTVEVMEYLRWLKVMTRLPEAPQ